MTCEEASLLDAYVLKVSTKYPDASRSSVIRTLVRCLADDDLVCDEEPVFPLTNVKRESQRQT